MPWLLLFFLEGWGLFLVERPWAGPAKARKAKMWFLTAFAAACLAMSVASSSLRPHRSLGPYQEGIDWIKQNTTHQEHYLSRSHRGLALLAGRTGAFYDRYNLADGQARIKEFGLRLIVIDKKKEERAILPWATSQGGFSLAWDNQVLAVYRQTP